MRLRTGSAALVLLVTIVVVAGRSSGPIDAAAAADATGVPGHFAFGLQAGTGSNGAMNTWMVNSGVPWDFAWTYLNSGWDTTWSGTTPGKFALDYATNARARGYIPVFTYYLVNTMPSACTGRGAARALCTLNSSTDMRAYFANFRLLMQRLGSGTYGGITGYGGTVIVHVEPDLAGFAEQAALNNSGQCYGYCTAQGNDPSYVKAAVASSGDSEVSAFPNTFQGYNWALIHLRDQYAPNVLLAFNISNWATNVDISSNTSTSVDGLALGRKAGDFAVRSGFAGNPPGLGSYDLVFNDPADHDAGWQKYVNANPNTYWDRLNVTVPNFRRWEEYLRGIHATTGRWIYAWQVPMGNQFFATQDNSPGHYQDNRAEYIFGHVAELAEVGLAGVLFGQGSPNTTYTDRAADGITNPPSFCSRDGLSSGVVCNDHASVYPDDDGGYLRLQGGTYYAQGPYPLPLAAPTSPDPTTSTGQSEAPTVTLTTMPPAVTTSTKATFSWVTGGTVVKTLCSLDGSPASSCASPKSYIWLSRGSHTFRVSVSNPAGSAAAGAAWTIKRRAAR